MAKSEIIIVLETDDDTHAVYLRFNDEKVTRTVACDANIDVDANGDVVGVELLWWGDSDDKPKAAEPNDTDDLLPDLPPDDPALNRNELGALTRRVDLLESFVHGRQEQLGGAGETGKAGS